MVHSTKKNIYGPPPGFERNANDPEEVSDGANHDLRDEIARKQAQDKATAEGIGTSAPAQKTVADKGKGPVGEKGPTKGPPPQPTVLPLFSPQQMAAMMNFMQAMVNSTPQNIPPIATHPNNDLEGHSHVRERTPRQTKSAFSRLGSSRDPGHERYNGLQHRDQTWAHYKDHPSDLRTHLVEKRRTREPSPRREHESPIPNVLGMLAKIPTHG